MPLSLTVRKRLLTAVHDVFIAGLSLWIALALRYGLENMPDAASIVLACVGFALIATVAFAVFGTGKGIWRFASVADMRSIVLSSTATVVAFSGTMFLMNRLAMVPRAVPLLAWFVMIVLLSGPRLIFRMIKDHDLKYSSLFRAEKPQTNLLLVAGATQANELIRRLQLETSRTYRLLGILDKASGGWSRTVRGIPILGAPAEIEAIVGRLRSEGAGPDAIVLTFPSPDGEVIRHVVNRAASLGVAVKRVAEGDPLKANEASAALSNVTLDDLLGRPPVKLNVDRFHDFLTNRVVLITGAGGSIGSEIARQVMTFRPKRLVLVDASEFNLYSIDKTLSEVAPDIDREAVIASVQDDDRIARLMARIRPEIVFHAAALKHVPLVEANACEGVLTNIIGTRNVADAAVVAGVRAVVMISTDKAVRPSSLMGATKRVAECYCQSLDVEAGRTQFITVRFGNVLGSNGSVVPLFERQIRAGGPVTVTHKDMRRYFMTIREATELVLQAAGHRLTYPDRRGEILVLDMGEPVRIVDLARTMIALSGHRPEHDIPIVFTGPRPGEKLFEELFDAAEATVATETAGIFAASPRVIDRGSLLFALERLEKAAKQGQSDQVRRLLAAITPEFAGAVPTEEVVETAAAIVLH